MHYGGTSQGLKLNRVAYCDYSTGVFTNLSRDHIGFGEHSTMDEYAEAKSKLFSMSKQSVLNADASYFDLMTSKANKSVTYGIENDCDFKAINIVKFADHVEYDVVFEDKCKHVYVSSPGTFSVYNSLAAIGNMLC